MGGGVEAQWRILFPRPRVFIPARGEEVMSGNKDLQRIIEQAAERVQPITKESALASAVGGQRTEKCKRLCLVSELPRRSFGTD